MRTSPRPGPQAASAENVREFPDGGHEANSRDGREKPESGHGWFNSMAGKRPPGALTWRTSDERKKLLEAWYDEVGVRGSKLEIRLAGILIAKLNWSGSTPVKDKELMRRLRCKRAWVQSGLKGLEDMGAIIRDTVMTATRNRTRTLYLSRAILGGLSSTVLDNGLSAKSGDNGLSSTVLDNGVVHDRTRHKNNDRAPAPARASSRSSVGPRNRETPDPVGPSPPSPAGDSADAERGAQRRLVLRCMGCKEIHDECTRSVPDSGRRAIVELWEDRSCDEACKFCGALMLVFEMGAPAAVTLPTEPRTGFGEVSQSIPPSPYSGDLETPPAASPEPQQPQRPPLDGAFTQRWIAERVEWAAREWSKPDKDSRHFVGLEITCSKDDGGCGLSIAPAARWVDLSWNDEQGAKDEYDTLRRLPCPHCGEIGTAVMEFRLIPDVASAPALQPISTSEASGAQDDAAEDPEDIDA